MAKTIGAVISLKDNMSATLRGIKKEQKTFRDDVKSTRKELENTFKKKLEAKLDATKAHKILQQLKSKLDPLRKRIVTTLAYKDMATRRIKEVTNKAKVLAKMAINPIIRAKDKASSIIDGIKNKLFSLKGIAATALGVLGVGAGVGKMLGDGAMLEQQQISMEHFIGANNKGKSKGDVKKSSQQYLKDLRDNANATPFSTQEVVSAGTRAINIAGGDTKSAMDLVKLSENMAALNPEKSLNDAIEALADLKVGETERMKEFGFKISQDDVKAAGGDFSKIKNAEGISITDMFAGGADKLSGSAAGLFSTITGKVGSMVQDMGLQALEPLKPVMQSVITWMDKMQPTMAGVATKVGEFIGAIVSKLPAVASVFGDIYTRIQPAIDFIISGISSFIGYISSNFPQIKETIGNAVGGIAEKFSFLQGQSGFLKEVVSTAWNGIKSVIQIGVQLIIPALGLVGNAAKLLFNAFKVAFPAIKGIVSGVWGFIKPILKLMSGAIEGVSNALGKVGDGVGWVANKLGVGGSKGGGKTKKNPKQNALGTSYYTGGTVDERGGEIKILPDGSKVIPHDVSVKALKEDVTPKVKNQTQILKQTLNPFKIAPYKESNVQNKTQAQTVNQVVQKDNTTGLQSIYQQIQRLIDLILTLLSAKDDNNINININGVDKSVNEIINELIPQLKLALANM